MRTVPRKTATRPPTVMAILVSAALVAGVATAAPAQSGRNLERPVHWQVRYDDGAGAAERRFVRVSRHAPQREEIALGGTYRP